MINYYITEFLAQGDSVGVLRRNCDTAEEQHTHAFFDVILPISGDGNQLIDGKSYEFKQGALYFIDRSIPHSLRPATELQYRELLIAPDFFEAPADGEELRRISIPIPSTSLSCHSTQPSRRCLTSYCARLPAKMKKRPAISERSTANG